MVVVSTGCCDDKAWINQQVNAFHFIKCFICLKLKKNCIPTIKCYFVSTVLCICKEYSRMIFHKLNAFLTFIYHLPMLLILFNIILWCFSGFLCLFCSLHLYSQVQQSWSVRNYFLLLWLMNSNNLLLPSLKSNFGITSLINCCTSHENQIICIWKLHP